MMRTNGTYIFQSTNFEKKNRFTNNANNESAASLFNLFIHDLKEMYWSEMILVKSLMKMIKNSTNLNLIQLLKQNLDITVYQITKIEDLFSVLNEKISSKKCDTINQMLIETNDYIKHYEKGIFKDEIMMTNLQKIAQFKIDAYESFYEYANRIGEGEAAAYLLELLNEELELDAKLAEMLDSSINTNIPAYY